MQLLEQEVRSSADPEVYEGSQLHELTHIFDEEVQMVVVPFPQSAFAAWSPEACWEQSRRDGRFAVRTPDGSANRHDLKDGFDLHEGLGQLLTELSEVHATLFGAEEVGLRWVWTDRPTCPRFHEDRLVVRGIYNHCGPTTEWVPSRFVDRNRLGHLSEGLALQ